MPAAARKGDKDTTGLGQINDGTVGVVKINGKDAAVVGSKDTPHPPKKGKHGVPSPVVAGSGVVKFGGKAAARVGDQFECGHAIAEGSPNVTVG